MTEQFQPIDICRWYDIVYQPQVRNSRFDYNARYIRFDEALNSENTDLKQICLQLATKKNFEPIPIPLGWVAYRRGSDGLFLYFCPAPDFRVSRERKNHKGQKQVDKTLC